METRPRQRRHRLPPETYRGMVRAAFDMCVREHRRLFVDPWIVSSCVGALSDVIRADNCVALAYCFMPDHLHLVLEGRSVEADLLASIARFKQKTGHWLARNTSQAQWQRSFYDSILWTDEQAWERVRYVFNNPVRWELVEQWWEYPGSGCLGVEVEAVLGEVPAESRLNAYCVGAVQGVRQ